MTEDTSPENLRKFLESDDPALVMMVLSMAKGAGVPEELLPTILSLYMWNDDKTIRAAAKSVFNKYAPDDLKGILKGTWNTSYRTIKTRDALEPKAQAILWDLEDTLLDTVDVWKPALDRTSGDRLSIVRVLAGSDGRNPYVSKDMKASRFFIGFGAEAVKPLIRALGMGRGNFLRDDLNVREAAAEALGRIGDERAVEPLIRALGEDDSYFSYVVREAAAEALGEIGDKRAVEPLIKALGDDDRDNQWGITIRWLDVIEEALEKLKEVLEDEDENLREAAKEALKKLGHEVE